MEAESETGLFWFLKTKLYKESLVISIQSVWGGGEKDISGLQINPEIRDRPQDVGVQETLEKEIQWVYVPSLWCC